MCLLHLSFFVFQFIACRCFIFCDKQKNVSVKRIQLLSDRTDSEFDSSKLEFSKNSSLVSLVTPWDHEKRKKQTGYGTIARPDVPLG